MTAPEGPARSSDPSPGVSPEEGSADFPAGSPLLTVIVPNRKTPELTKICLRLLRKHTDFGKVRIIAVDNDSGDDSLAYLRKLPWITLIERKVPSGESGPDMHAKALDEALARVDTPFVMVMHTDTFVLRDGWADCLLDRFDADDVAGVGSWKLEKPRPLFLRAAHRAEEMLRRLIGRKVGTEVRYLRSHCAVYRTELLRRYTKGFYDGESAGKAAHLKLVAAGFKMVFLPSDELGKYISHLNHATMILNPAPGDRKTGRASARDRIDGRISFFADILAADDLDL
ncbi:MAG: glycosyltransferase [Lentisphaeria bacterium]|nr:glycosyltransferase [Lentisphaeria bacterium]